jgi:hypothetical protein
MVQLKTIHPQSYPHKMWITCIYIYEANTRAAPLPLIDQHREADENNGMVGKTPGMGIHSLLVHAMAGATWDKDPGTLPIRGGTNGLADRGDSGDGDGVVSAGAPSTIFSLAESSSARELGHFQ